MLWRFWLKKKKIALCPQDVEQITPAISDILPEISAQACNTQPLVIIPAEAVKEVECLQPLLPLSACEKCGACCAFFPVNFPDIEKDDLLTGTLLAEMSIPVSQLLRVMRGTECRNPRCAALEGEIGKKVRCLIYAGRPSTCRNFNRSWENNIGNTLCDRARAVYGLQPFSQY